MTGGNKFNQHWLPFARQISIQLYIMRQDYNLSAAGTRQPRKFLFSFPRRAA